MKEYLHLKKVLFCIFLFFFMIFESFINVGAVSSVKEINKEDIILQYVDDSTILKQGDKVFLNKKIIIKLKDDIDFKNMHVKYRIQELKTKLWKPLGDFKAESPSYSFSSEGTVNLQLDILNVDDPKNQKGIWLGQFIVLDSNKIITQKINRGDIIVESKNSGTTIKQDVFVGETINIKYSDSTFSKEFKFRLQDKIGDFNWIPIGEFNSKPISYTFQKEGITSLQLDVQNSNYALDDKGIWLGQFFVKKQTFRERIVNFVKTYPIVIILIVLTFIIYIISVIRKVIRRG